MQSRIPFTPHFFSFFFFFQAFVSKLHHLIMFEPIDYLTQVDQDGPSGLSDEQKKVCELLARDCLFARTNSLTIQAHHILSEQKRRLNIRTEFDRIVDLTPALRENERRSELAILTKGADYLEELALENKKLVELCKQHDVPVPPGLAYNGPQSSGME